MAEALGGDVGAVLPLAQHKEVVRDVKVSAFDLVDAIQRNNVLLSEQNQALRGFIGGICQVVGVQNSEQLMGRLRELVAVPAKK